MDYPKVKRNLSGWKPGGNVVSIDFEFDYNGPTILGFSTRGNAVSVPWSGDSRSVLGSLEAGGVVWLGHNLLTTEKQIIESELGVTLPLERMEDSMVLHYLCNSELCKSAPKSEDDEDTKGQGFMDLWSMASLYTELPQWKRCRGVRCAGPCPIHDPFGYNGVDALAVDIAYPRLLEDTKEKKIPRELITHLYKLSLALYNIQKQGVRVDVDYINNLEKQLEDNKQSIFPCRWEAKVGKKGQELKSKELVWDAPFNPRSPKQVMEWFKERGVLLDSTEKDDVEKAIRRYAEATDGETLQWLEKLEEYKSEGKSLKAWFDGRHIHNGFMYPRFSCTSTSTGRLSSFHPNFQNIPRVGFGKKVRAAIIPRPGFKLVKADYSQLELRMVLWYAGVREDFSDDAFTWLVQAGGGVFEEAAEAVGNGKSARDMAKSVSHGGDYGEGIVVLYPKDFNRARIKSAIDKGALVVDRDWEYNGGIVSFTGINLAERFFGSATFENRKRALEIQEAYFKRFWQIREWQKQVSREAERGFARSASGRYLELHGTAEDKLKIALALKGQGSGADYCQEAMIKYYERDNTPLLQVHDELVFEVPVETSNKNILEFFSTMSEESKFFPGFSCPAKVKVGMNWLDMEEVKA